MTHRLRIMLSLLLLLAAPIGVCCQVNFCYQFDDCAGNSRPAGWGALPNLDFNYVGVLAYDNTAISGAHSLHIKGNVCYALMPDEGIDYAGDGVWLSFRYYLAMNTTRIEVGYLTNASDTSTFHLLKTVHYWGEWYYNAVVDLSSVPMGARVAFRSRDIMAGDGTFWLDNVFVTSEPCEVEVMSLRVTGNWADSVRLEWIAAGNPSVSIGIGSNTYSPTGNSITVPRFFPETSYASPYYHLRFIDSCDGIQYQSPCRFQGLFSYFNVPPYREGPCVAVTDSYSSMALPYVGTPVEPYLELGPRSTDRPGVTGVYRGSHTITTNPNAEAGTGQMIFPCIIPPGDAAVMRLGNRLGDWESASMLYTISVDTAVSDLLVVKYTVAMNDGVWMNIGGGPAMEHVDSTHPPRFSIELLDDTLGPLPTADCHRVALDGMSTEGWDALDERNNSYSRRNFTAVGFDLRPYHGQRVRLRITATDGALNNRWCYAYYNTECIKQHDVVGGCDVDSVTLTAPFGFRYSWWRDYMTAADTARSITVATDGTLWHCTLADPHNPSCTHTIHRRALGGPLVELRDTVTENELPYAWYGVTFASGGDSSVMLPAATGCDTTLVLHLHVCENQHVRVERRVCPDKWPIVWQGHTFNGVDSVEVTYTDVHGADSVVTYVAVEAPAYELADTVVICPWSPFVYDGTDYGGPGTYDIMMTSVDGCDSTLHVTLTPRDSAFRARSYHSVDGLAWADTVPIVLCSGQQLQVVDSTENAEEWLWTLGGAGSSAARTATFAFGDSDTVTAATLTLDVTSGGCHDTVVWPVVVFPTPAADFAWWPEHPVDVEPQMQLQNLTVPDSCRWLWLIGEDSVAGYEPYYRWPGYTAPGEVAVTLKAWLTMRHDSIAHTCMDTATRQVEIVTCWLEFPSLVTPNGDGVNDTWEVVNLVEMGQYPTNEVWIYNQWGVRVFHAKDIKSHDQCWDPNTPPCPDGTYYFRFQASNKYGLVRRNGVIEVLR